MKLSNTTLTKLVKGAVYFENEKGYLCMRRFSKAQTDYMAAPSYDYLDGFTLVPNVDECFSDKIHPMPTAHCTWQIS